MSIVIVDDSVTTLVVLKQLAKGMGGLPVVTFSKPSEALSYLSENGAHIVVVDCEMPEMNGIEFIAAVRSNPPHRSTPIVMVTQHSATEIRNRAIEAGATDFLNKPIDAAEFKLRIRNLVRLSGRELELTA